MVIWAANVDVRHLKRQTVPLTIVEAGFKRQKVSASDQYAVLMAHSIPPGPQVDESTVTVRKNKNVDRLPNCVPMP